MARWVREVPLTFKVVATCGNHWRTFGTIATNWQASVLATVSNWQAFVATIITNGYACFAAVIVTNCQATTVIKCQVLVVAIVTAALLSTSPPQGRVLCF
jgi:hypothetical protein